MSSDPFSRIWAGLGESHGYHTVPDASNIPSFMFPYPENVSPSARPLLMNPNALPVLSPLGAGYTVPSTSASSDADTWLANDTPLNFATAATFGPQVIDNDNDFPLNSPPIDLNAVSSIKQPSMTVTVPRARSRKPDSRHRGSKANRERHAGSVRCEWKGCTYTGLFARKAELKRHVETQHIFPNSYECLEPRCMRTFNRRDNLNEHLRRTHF
ncbi:hypothetical protein BDV30DRAFT_139839 [Aspergillus minisclerotigenes]|uniref:C2H2-type domain-containing protein n=1 Tax=Aspergillus minisclerotigenes TaxID=656917 RepID=A0A5N6JIV0_9EURO|nr:hypothetical protein BDV30DRAFT_139839 [Aspergillus minisclerotigenes]